MCIETVCVSLSLFVSSMYVSSMSFSLDKGVFITTMLPIIFYSNWGNAPTCIHVCGNTCL